MSNLRAPLASIELIKSPLTLPADLLLGFIGKVCGLRRDSILDDQELLLRRFSAKNLFLLQQVHGSEILDLSLAAEKSLAENMPASELQFDGIALPARPSASWQKETLFAIKTADCLPIFLISDRKILLLHAGWRGLAAGIIGRAVSEFGPFDFCWIAPHIARNDYEVGPEVIEAFGGAAAYQTVSHDKYLLDLGATAILLLRQAQELPLHICCSNESTYQSSRLHSYRRDAHNRGSNLLIFSYEQSSPVISGN